MFKRIRPKLTAIYTWLCKSFSRKIMSALLICMSLIILVSSVVYYYSTVDLLKNEYIIANGDLLEEVNQSVQRYYEQLDEVTLSLYSDNDFIDNLRYRNDDYVSLDYNEQTIKNILYADDNIQYIYFYTPYNQTLFSFPRQNVSHSYFPEIEQEKWYQKTISDKRYFYIEPLHTFQNYNHFGSLKNEHVFSVNRALRYYVTGEIIGVISISYDTGYLEKICQNLTSPDGYIAVLNEELNPLLISWPEVQLPDSIRETLKTSESSNGHCYYSLDGEKRILLWNNLDGCYVLKDIPLKELTQNAVTVLQIIVTFSGIIFLISIFVSFYLTRSATHKLKILAQNIAEFGKGNLTINAEDYGIDEIGTLASAFNNMTEQINELINLEYKAQLLKKSAELQALQAQIKPHYINNALQALGTLGLKKGATDVYYMANALAKNMRYSLKTTTQLVPMKQEIENMNDYLFIQKILWGDRLTVELKTEADINDRLVPVFILQPLVENSIKHGLDNCRQGHILIEIQTLDTSLSIKVEDNGQGIPPASLKLLQEWLNESDISIAADEHIGLRNIYNRIRLIYGEKGTFTVDSSLGNGTTIHIILPEEEKTHV